MSKLEDLASHCIRCGFCLESCPTFVLTGEETESPRGRIYLARSADDGELSWEQVKPHLDRCLGCRACETACPSGVEYGQILEIARDQAERAKPHRTKHALLNGMTDPQKLRIQLMLGKLWPGKRIPSLLSRLLSGGAPEADLPKPQALAPLEGGWGVKGGLRSGFKSGAAEPQGHNPKPSSNGTIYLLEGCAMRVLFPQVHAATRGLIHRIGYQVKETQQGCCGALHAHNGHLEEAGQLASKLIQSMPGDLPIVVNSAGCGSAMKEYVSLPHPSGGEGRGGGVPFADRVQDISEFLLANGLIEQLKKSNGIQATVTYHDACHLAHGQGIRIAPRELLQAIPNLNFVELEEADMCCGSAGIYNLTQPKMARQLLERKWAHIEETRATIVATGNPGCHAWIEQAAREHGRKVKVMHTAELLEASFSGLLEAAD